MKKVIFTIVKLALLVLWSFACASVGVLATAKAVGNTGESEPKKALRLGYRLALKGIMPEETDDPWWKETIEEWNLDSLKVEYTKKEEP